MCPVCFTEDLANSQCTICQNSDEIRSQYDNAFPGLPVGTRINNGRYTIGRILGVGGFGITYLSYDPYIRRKVAIKEFYPRDIHEVQRDETNRIYSTASVENLFSSGLRDFIKEAQTLSKFEDHPNIVTVLDFFQDNGTAYMVMVYLTGITLQDHLNILSRQRQYPDQPLISQPRTIDTIMIVLDALREVHTRSCFHRDIKPQNIMLADGVRPVLIDFGSAKLSIGSRSQQLFSVISHGFSPLEQYQSDDSQHGPWTDVYAVAATIYNMVTGEVPTSAVDRMQYEVDSLKRPDEIVNGLTKEFCDVIMKGLALRPHDRFDSATSFQHALIAAYPDHPYNIRPGGKTGKVKTRKTKPPKPQKSKKKPSSGTPATTTSSNLVPIVLSGFLVVLLGGLLFLLWKSNPTNPVENAFNSYQDALAGGDPQEISTASNALIDLYNDSPGDMDLAYKTGLMYYNEGNRLEDQGQQAESDAMYDQCFQTYNSLVRSDTDMTYPDVRVIGIICLQSKSTSDDQIPDLFRQELQTVKDRYPNGPGKNKYVEHNLNALLDRFLIMANRNS